MEPIYYRVADVFAAIRCDDPVFHDTLKVELDIGRTIAREIPLSEIAYLLRLVHRIRSAPTESARLIVLEEARRAYDESFLARQRKMSEPLGFLLRRHGHPPASGNQNPAPPAPEGNGKPDAAPASGNQSPPPEAPGIDYEALADALRRDGKTTPAKLVEYMANRDFAPCDDVGREVHGDQDRSEQAVRMNARRTNEALAKMGFRVSFRVTGARVYKDVSPG